MPKLCLTLLLAAAAALATKTAHAQFSADYDRCHERAHGNTVQEGLCAQKELTSQDDRLNKAYQTLMSQYGANSEKKISLRDEERTWLKKRDYDCKLNRDTIDNGCLLDKTAQRADFLEHKLKF